MSEDHLRHASATEGFDHSEVQPGLIVAFAIGSVFFLVLTIVAVEVYFNKVWDEAVYEKVLAPPSEQLKALHYREDWYLTHYMYADKKSGVVRIPLDRAMSLYEQEASQGKLFYPAKSYIPKKEEPVPAAPGAPGAAATPAPAGQPAK
jgi:stringent starvation protein B